MLTLFQNRPAWRLETSELRVTIMQCGAHVAETVLKRAGGINPLWIPDQPTIDSDQFDPGRDGGRYGDDAEARLISGLLGHNLCLPFWGPPSASEFAAGMTFHGETNIVRWQEVSHTPSSLTIEATLPNSGIRVERSIVCRGPVVFYETTAENLTSWDRPLAWCEHVTVGPPFLAARDTRFYASLLNGFRTGDSATQFLWPQGCSESPCDLSFFGSAHDSELVNSFTVNTNDKLGYFVACNARVGLLFGYAFASSEFPWLNIWESNNQKRRTRGMEFSNT
ncbi:MAG: hypothetical protein JO270_19580, partial [Acidobacteriaceae bacterium]|nr:hypothetical protein [Acidobacteriaceae bacterium]